MKTSNNGIDLIASFEGCKLTAYLDAVGVWTIGYGHTGNVKKGQKITKEQAKTLLKKDVEKFETAVNKAVSSNTISFVINQNQFDALVSFTYNLGAGNLAKLCKGRSAEEVAEAMLNYNKAGGKVLAGLTNRRNKERELFLSGTTSTTTAKKTTSKTTTTKKEVVINNPYRKPPTSITFRKGMISEYIKWIQYQVNKKANTRLDPDGEYGDKTERAVIKFQNANGLEPDGVCGPITLRALY